MKNNSYGIKEVADLKLYHMRGPGQITGITKENNSINLTWTGGTAEPVAVFDSLKVSNIEVASESTSATGGKGNAELLSWSYGKSATLSITNALLSPQSLALMFGAIEGNTATNKITIDSKTFPDFYQFIGLTVIRNYKTGKDEPFVFYIPKGMIQVGGSLTMESEGDPSTFEMTIKALAQDLGNEKDVLIKFYHLDDGEDIPIDPPPVEPDIIEVAEPIVYNYTDSYNQPITYEDNSVINAVVTFNGEEYDVEMVLEEVDD